MGPVLKELVWSEDLVTFSAEQYVLTCCRSGDLEHYRSQRERAAGTGTGGMASWRRGHRR